MVDRPDCYYRVGDERRLLDTFGYNLLRVTAVRDYYRKFRVPVKQSGLSSNLLGPVLETYLQLLYHTRTGQLSTTQLKKLETELFDGCIKIGRVRKLLFRLLRYYNMYLPRVSGINYGFKKFIVK